MITKEQVDKAARAIWASLGFKTPIEEAKTAPHYYLEARVALESLEPQGHVAPPVLSGADGVLYVRVDLVEDLVKTLPTCCSCSLPATTEYDNGDVYCDDPECWERREIDPCDLGDMRIADPYRALIKLLK